MQQPPASTASTTIRRSSEARGSPPAPRRPYRRRPHRGLAAEVFRSTGLPWRSLLATALLWCLLICPRQGGAEVEVEVVNCCTGPGAVVDCSSGVDYHGQVRRFMMVVFLVCVSALRPCLYAETMATAFITANMRNVVPVPHSSSTE